MLTTLSELPRVIDAFVSGVVEFAYRFVAGVLRLDAHPAAAAVRLQARPRDLSSRTMLFLGSATWGAARFVTIPNLDLMRREAGAGAVLMRIIAVYVVFDLLCHAAAAIVGREPHRRRVAVSLMRYGFAAALASTSAFALLVQSLQVAGVLDLQPLLTSGPRGLPLAGLLALAALMSAASWYQPAAIFIALFNRRRKVRAPSVRLAAASTGLVMAVLTYSLYGLQIASASVEGVVGGRFLARNLDCRLRNGEVSVAFALVNERINTLVLSRRTLSLRIAPEMGEDQDGFKALAARHFDRSLRSLEGDVVVVRPGETAVLRAVATLRPRQVELVGHETGAAACTLVPRKLDSPELFGSANAMIDLSEAGQSGGATTPVSRADAWTGGDANSDSDGTGGERDLDGDVSTYRGVPIYRPGSPRRDAPNRHKNTRPD